MFAKGDRSKCHAKTILISASKNRGAPKIMGFPLQRANLGWFWDPMEVNTVKECFQVHRPHGCYFPNHAPPELNSSFQLRKETDGFAWRTLATTNSLFPFNHRIFSFCWLMSNLLVHNAIMDRLPVSQSLSVKLSISRVCLYVWWKRIPSDRVKNHCPLFLLSGKLM